MGATSRKTKQNKRKQNKRGWIFYRFSLPVKPNLSPPKTAPYPHTHTHPHHIMATIPKLKAVVPPLDLSQIPTLPSPTSSSKHTSSSPSNKAFSSKPPTPSSPMSASHKTPTTLKTITFPYLQLSRIGRGSFSSVYLTMNATTGELVAMKKLARPELPDGPGAERAKKAYDSAVKTFYREIEVVSNLRHPHVVGYLGVEINPLKGDISIFMEYTPTGSLSTLLSAFGPLNSTIVSTYTRQLLLGLSFLHHCGIAHRDIKGGNVLVSEDTIKSTSGGSSSDNGVTLKLADFGSSRDLYKEGGNSTVRTAKLGTPLWSAPEVIRNEVQGSSNWQKADIWSLGCTVIEMTTAKPPWYDKFENTNAALMCIASPTSNLPFPNSLSSVGKDFLASCIDSDAAARLSPQQLLHHPFVAKPHSAPSGSGSGRLPRSGISSQNSSFSTIGDGTVSTGGLGSGRSGGSDQHSHGGQPPPSPSNIHGTPPLNLRKKRNDASPGVGPGGQRLFNPSPSTGSQWTSSRRTPPVSPGAHIGVGGISSPSIQQQHNHNVLKPIARSSSSPPVPSSPPIIVGGASHLQSHSARKREPTPPTSLVNILESAMNEVHLDVMEERAVAMKVRRKLLFFCLLCCH